MRARVAAFLCLVAASDRGGPGPGAGWSRVEPAAFAQELARPARGPRPQLAIVDVREPDLFRKSHLPGAINLPHPAGGMKRWRGPVESGL